MDPLTEKFESLFSAHSDAVFRHLYYRLGNRERAKELTQEVFMRLWQHLATGKTVVHEKAFLYRIAHNLFVNEIRTDKTSLSLDKLTDETSFDVIDNEVSPEQSAVQNELLTYLVQLQDSYREVLVMRYIDGLGIKDIAELLNEKETNISMRINRALEKLRAVYNRQD